MHHLRDTLSAIDPRNTYLLNQENPLVKDNDLFEGTPRLIPAYDRVVVEKLEVDRAGRLFLPASAQDSTTMGRIVAVSDSDPASNWALEDLVLFGANSGYDVQVGLGNRRKRFIVLRASEILAKVVFEKEEPQVAQAEEGPYAV